jgi:hypothetical protein
MKLGQLCLNQIEIDSNKYTNETVIIAIRILLIALLYRLFLNPNSRVGHHALIDLIYAIAH